MNNLQVAKVHLDLRLPMPTVNNLLCSPHLQI